MYYFAYGSNMLRACMQDRAPSARFVTTARLNGHVLKFHKRSPNDGSGECDAVETGKATDTVCGVVYEIAESERARLDQAEGLGRGYLGRELCVEVPGGHLRAYTHVADPASVDGRLHPTASYRDLLVAGAQENGLPEDYLRFLRSCEAGPERLARAVIYESPWVNLYVDSVRFPDGRTIERHHLLDFPRPSVVVLVEDAQGSVLLVRQWRYTTGHCEWELPAGGMEEGETPAQAAEREVLEETGYRTTGHELLCSYHPMDGISNRLFHVCRCRSTERAGDPDGEVNVIRWFSRDEARQMVASGTITCGLSLMGLLYSLLPGPTG